MDAQKRIKQLMEEHGWIIDWQRNRSFLLLVMNIKNLGVTGDMISGISPNAPLL